MPDDTNGQLGRRTFLKATGAASAAAAVGVTDVMAGRGQTAADAQKEVVVNVAGAADFERAKQKAAEQFDGTVVHANKELSYVVVKQESGLSLSTVETQAADEPEFRSTERNRMYEAHAVDDPRLEDQYAPQQTNAVDVWEDGFLGDKDVSIAVIDTGTDYEHETLESRYDENVGEDFAGGDGDPAPPRGEQHGTHVSGIAAATTDEGTGVAGQSNAKLYSVRALGGGRGSLTDIADSIQWAADQGVDIINMSLGGGGRTDLMKNAVSNAYNAGVTIFASAGNSGRRGVSYPSGYEECISVSAVDDNEDLASFSQFGDKVEITAPGVDVLSTLPDDTYGRFSGTSMSSPAAAGVAALGLAADTSLSNNELRAKLKETARDIGLSDAEQGAGHADAKALVDALGGGGGDDPPEEPPEEPPEDPEEPTGSLSFADQTLGSDGAVTVSSVSTGQASTVVVTYTDGSEEIIAGLAGANNLDGQDVDVAIEDAGGFPGEHTAWVFANSDLPSGIAVGDDATPVAGAALDSASAEVTEAEEEPPEEPEEPPECGDETAGGSADGSFGFFNRSDSYTYTAETEDPCQIDFVLSGPQDVDFDLIVSSQGESARPGTPGANEQVIAQDPEPGQEFEITIEAVAGFGGYTIEVEEIGA